MVYLLSYLLFTIFATTVLVFSESSFEANIAVLVVQVLTFYLMHKRYSRKNLLTNYEFKETYHQKINIKRQPINIKVANWAFLVFVFLMSEVTVIYMQDIAYYISSSLNIILMLYIVWPLIKESYYGFKQNNFLGNVLMIFGAIGLIYVVNITYTLIFEYFDLISEAPVNQQIVIEMITANKWRLFFEITILAAISEELVFRGVAFRALINRSRILAYVVTFLAFGIPHLLAGFVAGNGLAEFMFLPLYGLMGVIFAYVYERSNSIFTSMVAHFLNNLIAFIAIINL